MKRYLGLDLGIKSLGIAVSDKTNTLATPVETFSFAKEDYDSALKKVEELVKTYAITDIILGLPKNMDNSLGFAAKRSIHFKTKLEKSIDNVEVHLFDERLSTVEALNILKENNVKKINKKNVVDTVSANIILENYLRGLKNNE